MARAAVLSRSPPRRRRSLLGRVVGFVFKLVLALLLFTIGWALLYRFVNPPLTWPMARDAIGGRHVEREWRSLDAIAPAVMGAAIGAEDARFCSHNGFDMQGIAVALARNAAGESLRGGSTISQQTAKNAFLWPGRSWLRKGLEAYFTVLIEALWGKPRIMEVYLNIAEMGIGVYGVEAASRHYFDTSADKLTPAQAARLAAILPQPIKRDARSPRGYTKRYARSIEKRIRVVRREGVDACVR